MNILFITCNPLGDAILTSGVLYHLIQTYPNSRITVAASSVALPLLTGAPQVVASIPIKKLKYSTHWLKLWLKTVNTPWDLVVDLRGSIVSWLLWTKKRWQFKPRRVSVHRVLQIQEALKLPYLPSPHIMIHSKAEKALLSKWQLPKRYIVFVPATHWPPKTWPLVCFKQLIEKVWAEVDAEMPILITGAAHERDQIQPLLDWLPKKLMIDKIGASLPETALFLSRSTAFVGNDSGLMHLSAAMGAPTVGLFGPTNDTHYAPWGKSGLAVRTPENLSTLQAQLALQGEEQTLMAGLSVECVFEALIAVGLSSKRTLTSSNHLTLE